MVGGRRERVGRPRRAEEGDELVGPFFTIPGEND